MLSTLTGTIGITMACVIILGITGATAASGKAHCDRAGATAPAQPADSDGAS